MGKRAVVYSRVSTAEQAEDDKASLNEQERRCREYCRQKGYDVVSSYQDVGSGTTKKRQNFLRMLAEAKLKQFDIIVAWKADRLARGIYPCAALMEAIEEAGVAIETVAEPFDRTTFEIRAVVGRIEVENIVQRTAMGREAMMKAGHHHVKAPYGYDYDTETHRWRIIESEARWVKQIFDWYVEGVPSRRIARRLNAQGVATKFSSRLGWSEKMVSELVSQEYYCGRYYRNKAQHTKKPNKPEKWILTEAPAIITEEEWQEAKRRRAKNTIRSPRNSRRLYLTDHILQCEECGTGFHVSGGWSAMPRLMCRRMERYPHLAPCRLPKSVDYGKVARQLWGGIVQVVSTEGGLEAAVIANANRVKGKKEIIEQRLKELTAKRTDLELEQDRVISWARKGSITEKQLEKQIKAISAEAEQRSAEENRLLADLRLVGGGDEVYRQAQEMIPAMKTRVNGALTDEAKRDVIDTLVQRALLDASGDLTIEFKVPRPEMSFGSLLSC